MDIVFTAPDPDAFTRYAMLNRVEYRPLRSFYNGEEQRAFMIPAWSAEKLSEFLPDEVLYIDDYDWSRRPNVYTHSFETEVQKHIGRFERIQQEETSNFNSYFFEPLTNGYYVTR